MIIIMASTLHFLYKLLTSQCEHFTYFTRKLLVESALVYIVLLKTIFLQLCNTRFGQTP